MSSERKLERFRGRAQVQTVRRGTGSEHVGVVLETTGGERLNLVRLGGNPFTDPATDKLSGSTIEVEGYRIGTELRYVTVHEVS
jgi:hypothetical protein